MTINSIGGSAAAAGTASATSKPGAAPASSFDQILAAFKKEAAKTPAERARDQVLKQHGLTEDSYKSLPPEQKKAIDAEIATAVQRVLQTDKGKGFKGSETAANVSSDPTTFLA